jgi:molybdate transport system ATP-binding protein
VTLEVTVRKVLGAFTLDVAFSALTGITALFGPSGAGKTVTLRAIAGLMRPDRGRIALGSRALFDSGAAIDVPTRERRIGFVFQHYALFPHLTAAQNIAYGLADANTRAARVRELLELTELGDLARSYPRELSGGQQQRVALARALAPRPALVLLDEPFAAVDTFLRERLREQVRAIQAQSGVPMILVTHDLADVREIADAVVMYERGTITRAGPTDDVLASAGLRAALTH